MKKIFRLPFSRDRMRRDVDTELTFHLEGRIEELVAAGMSRGDAEHEAARRFGNREQVEAEVEHIDLSAHTQRAFRARIAAVGRDARYSVRGLVRRPLYTAAIVITLALAIGANTAIFSLVEAVLLRPIDVPGIGRLVVVHDDFPAMSLRRTTVSPPEAMDLFTRKELFSSATGMSSEGAVTEINGEQTRVVGMRSMGEFFTVFPVRPMRGRLFGPDESKAGSAPVVVLSYAFWQQLGADTAIVGKSVTLNDKPYGVIGILPPSFAVPVATVQYWRPFVIEGRWLNLDDTRGDLLMQFVARMKEGVSFDHVNTQVSALAAQWDKEHDYHYGGHTMFAQSFVEDQAGQLKPIVLTLFGAVAFVLLIACANVASLQLVRAAGRSREIAVRAALGAGRAAIARQLIVESAILAVAGGAAGVALGMLGLTWLTHLNVAQFPALKGLKLDSTVLAFTAATVVLAGAAFGTAPALRAARSDVNDALRDSGRGASAGMGRHRFLRASVVLQNALTLLLLVGAALTIRSLDRLMRVDLGFTPENIVEFSINLPVQRYPTSDARMAFFRSLDERLKAIAGVQSVGFAAGVPFVGGAGSTHYQLKDVPEQSGEPQRHANQAFVFGDYFKTMGIQIVRGRGFSDADFSSGAAVVVVDENLVKQSFGDRDPMGAEIEHGPSGTIIGVARSVKLRDMTEPSHPLVYHNAAHVAGGNLTAVLRSTLPSDAILKAARTTLRELDSRVLFGQPRTLTDRVSDSLGARRLAMNVIAGFAALSLVLALLGIYAVMSYVVGQRTKEIGIRVALGAQRAEIAGMVMKDGVVLAGIGLLAGVVVLVAVSKLLGSLLYGVGVFDPAALGAGVALLGGVTLVACYFPARRAVRVDPVVTLRSE